MKTVILVGAGATLAESLPTNPGQAKTPPLDTTFFELCQRANLDGQRTLCNYLKQHYGDDPFETPHRMEEVFNVVYADALSASPPAGSIGAYWALLKMYRQAIRQTTNRLSGRSRCGVGALLRFLLTANPNREFSFVTFNQDLVIEKCIEEVAHLKSYPNIPWNIRQAYAINFQQIVTLKGRRPGFSAQSSKLRRSTTVMKLHGSMNWVYKVRSADDAKNSLRTPSGRLLCVNDKYIYDSLLTIGRRRGPLLPLVVPPVYEKSTHIRDVLKPVWSEARAAIEHADELIVFGYSFPHADIAAQNMIRQAFFKNDNVDHLHVIDTDPSLSSRAGVLVNAPVITQYRTVQDFVDNYSPLKHAASVS